MDDDEMDEPVATDDHARRGDEALDDLYDEAGSPPGGEPDVFPGEVPPEEELAGSDPDPVAAETSAAADLPLIGGGRVLPEPRTSASAMKPFPDRPIKVVLTLRPGREPNEPGSTLIAVGSDGREPTLRYLDSGDLMGALAAVPELVAATIEAWGRRTENRPTSVRSALIGEGPTAPPAESSSAAQARAVSQGRRARGAEPTVEQASLFG